jgi:predicted nucleic acid-binding protein
VERVSPGDEEKAIEILSTYLDKGFSFTDATGFVVMKRLGIDTALTFDRHFRQCEFTAL